MRFSDVHGYQWSATEFALDARKCALYMGLGLGKTVVALTVAAIELYLGNTRRILVIAPLRVANTVWHTEAASWSHLSSLTFAIATGTAKQRMKALLSDADVHVINVDNVAWLVSNFPRSRWRWDFVIIDESSKFKSPSTSRFKALRKATIDKVLKIRGKLSIRASPVRHLLLLSATPATNGLEGLWSQFALMDNGKRLGRSYNAYLKRFFRNMSHDPQYAKYEPMPGAKDQIYKLVGNAAYVMRAEDYIELPPITYNNITVEMSDVQVSMYKELEREFLLELDTEDEFLTGEEGDEIIATNAGALGNKLLQFANGAVYTGETPESRKVEREYAVIHDTKIDALRDIVSAAEGNENLLVAYYYQSDLRRLKEAFPQAVVMDKAGQCIQPFNEGKIPLLLAHPVSAGMGLNLQRGASTIVFFSLLWSLEAYQQFIGRLYRQGQQNGVTVNHIVCKGTIEARVALALRANAETQQDFINALRQVPELEMAA